MAERNLRLHFQVLRVLEDLAIPYVVIGAFAGVSYGLNRITYDVDMVVDLNDEQIDNVVAAFPPPRYYADPYQIRDSIRLGILFNIIDSSQTGKVDLIPLTMEPGYDFALQNRIRRIVPTDDEEQVEAWLARPEDVIIGKLMAWNDGRSHKHETDIRDILSAIRFGLEKDITEMFDSEYIDVWANQIGEDALRLWEHIKEIVQSD